MDSLILTANGLIKTIDLKYKGKKYICKIQNKKETIDISLFLNNSLKYKGIISLEEIKAQIIAFSEYSITEVFEEINLLNTENFSIINEKEKYKLKIKFVILRKEKNIYIDLEDKTVTTLSYDDLANYANYYENIINYNVLIPKGKNIIFHHYFPS